eukprot:5575149-Pleurochrysis_carterae.AAC.1
MLVAPTRRGRSRLVGSARLRLLVRAPCPTARRGSACRRGCRRGQTAPPSAPNAPAPTLSRRTLPHAAPPGWALGRPAV